MIRHKTRGRPKLPLRRPCALFSEYIVPIKLCFAIVVKCVYSFKKTRSNSLFKQSFHAFYLLLFDRVELYG